VQIVDLARDDALRRLQVVLGRGDALARSTVAAANNLANMLIMLPSPVN
jgi:hypothetical protein